MFQRILLRLDGSRRAERVATIAARLARQTGGEILLLRITRDEVADPAQAFLAWVPWRAAADAYLKQVAESEPLAGVSVQTIIREGDAVSEILSVARSFAVDLIILSHQWGADEPLQSSAGVVARVAREAPMSVLLIPTEERSPLARSHQTPCALRLLVPLDGSPLAEASLAPAAIFLDALGGASERSSLHLAQIVASAATWRHAAHYLALVAERIRAGALTGRPLRVTWSVIPHADPVEALIHLAEVGEDPDTVASWSVARDLGPEPVSTPSATHDPGSAGAAQDTGFRWCDAIVMTTHGRGGLHHLLVGSVAERVLRMASMPLLLVRRAPDATPPRSLIAEPDVERWRL